MTYLENAIADAFDAYTVASLRFENALCEGDAIVARAAENQMQLKAALIDDLKHKLALFIDAKRSADAMPKLADRTRKILSIVGGGAA